MNVVRESANYKRELILVSLIGIGCLCSVCVCVLRRERERETGSGKSIPNLVAGVKGSKAQS